MTTFDPATIEAVLLDVGGVFVLPSPPRVADALRAAGLTPPDDLEAYRRAHYVGAAAFDRSDDQPETWPAYHQGFAEALGYAGADLEPAVRALTEAWLGSSREHWAWRQDGAVDAMTRLAALDIRLGVVSNADGTIEEILVEHGVCQIGEGDLVRVEVIVDSGVVGVLKPDPAIFRLALDALALPPERVLFIGDTLRNDVHGAQAAGLPVVQLDPYGLYADADHPRVASIDELVDLLGDAPR
jgi:putative hydrolase of the HAD superfamily